MLYNFTNKEDLINFYHLYKNNIDKISAIFQNRTVKEILLDNTKYLPETVTNSNRFYHLINGSEIPKCKYCGADCKFISLTNGYAETCNNKQCTNKLRHENKIKSIQNKYGVDNVSNLKTVKEKISIANKLNSEVRIQKGLDTIKERYGVDSPFKTPEALEKLKKVNHKEIIKKSLNTIKERYDVDNIMSLSETQQKIKETIKKIYGVDNILSLDSIKQKIKETNLEKYGTEYAASSDLVKNKMIETLQNRYGVSCGYQIETVKDKLSQTIKYKYNVDCIFKIENIKQKSRLKTLELSYNRCLKRIENKYETLFDFNEWIEKSGVSSKYKFKCIKCGLEFDDYPFYNYPPRCPVCEPKTVSQLEIKIKEFLDEFKINYEQHNRQLIKPLELDFYIPDKNIAIELHGLYWHDEQHIPNSRYHYTKYKLCFDKGIHLLQFFEDEIINEKKFDIVKSMILHRLKITPNKIFARKCEIKEVNLNDTKQFLLENHLQGYRYSKINLGLFYKNELISLLSMDQGKPKFIGGNQISDYEVVRFCNKKYTSVVGSYSKLLKYFTKNFNNNIYMYIDLRYSDIGNYSNDWKTDKISIGYYYIYQGKRYHRFSFTKQRLLQLCKENDVIIDSTDTESTLALKLDIQKVYDSGQMKLIYIS